MKKRWNKLGLIYCPSGTNRHPKLMSHAANPVPIHLDGDVYRIFFSGRDADNRSSVGAVDMDIINRKIILEHHQPFFESGPEGSFYADGVSIGNCYEVNGVKYMLFMGWQTPEDGHWRGDIGRLVVTPDLTLELDSDISFMPLSTVDPVSLSYPWVTQEDNGYYQMWYGSTVTWDTGNGEMLHVINHATSNDGEHWTRHGLSVPYQLGVAQAFSKPTVLKDNDGFHMWFSYRSGTGQKYRIGYAFSTSGHHWELRLDEAGIDISTDVWESEMIEYPFVFDHNGRNYLLYNGNSNGLTGFGLAVQEVL